MPDSSSPLQNPQASQSQKSIERLALIRHSVSHLMAEAVTRLFPGTRVAIGPSIESGFYYDFQFPAGGDNKPPIGTEDLADRGLVEIGRAHV